MINLRMDFSHIIGHVYEAGVFTNFGSRPHYFHARQHYFQARGLFLWYIADIILYLLIFITL